MNAESRTTLSNEIRVADWKNMVTNEKLTDDEERANDARIGRPG